LFSASMGVMRSKVCLTAAAPRLHKIVDAAARWMENRLVAHGRRRDTDAEAGFVSCRGGSPIQEQRTMNKRQMLVALSATAAGVLVPRYATAGSGSATSGSSVKFRLLHAFGATGSGGTTPVGGLLEATNGYFYGATNGGPYGPGTLFRLRPGGRLVQLHKFAGADGTNPVGGLIQASDGNIYGVTSRGGSDDYGTVFRLTLDGQLTTLHSFSYAGEQGYVPVSGLVQAGDGHLYGTTLQGPGAGWGTAYRMTLNGEVTTLHTFQYGEAEQSKSALIQASDGSLYGTSNFGGAYRDGTVYRLTLDGAFTLLKSFELGVDGDSPRYALLEGLDGRLYGSASSYSGSTSGGKVFSITTDGVYKILADLVQDTTGTPPTGALVQDAAGNLYGSTLAVRLSSVDYDGGAIYRLKPGGRLDVIYNFDRSSDGGGDKQIVFGSDGRLYGTTAIYGPDGAGTLFALRARQKHAAA
jgi:uncharacterized repeat protein (TIGR03803 family)